MDELVAHFPAETRESLAAMDFALVRLEQRPDDEATLSEIFRALHTIKGSCGFLGLPRLRHRRRSHDGGGGHRAVAGAGARG
jgi:two-component system chemotaxis sensor kinase CheA